MKSIKPLIIGIMIIAAGIGGAVILVATKPQAVRKRPPEMTPVVEVASIERMNHHARLELMGTIIPAETIELKARVKGEITRTHKDWIEGGRIPANSEILKIEDSDYSIALRQVQSEHTQAKSELRLEMGKQDVAKREWELVGKKGDGIDNELALRVPQLKSAQAREKAAKAKVEMAELNLKRTTVKAPFNALVVKRNVNIGDQASVSASLGTLVNTDRYHVRVSIPVDQLKWIELPDENKTGSAAEIVLQGGVKCTGTVIKLLADLEDQGRMARLLVEIRDPLKNNARVLLNSFVRVNIVGKQITDSYSVKRIHYRENDSIWLLAADKTLHVLQVQPIWSDRENIVFNADISEGEELITSGLSIVIEGMRLRVLGEENE
ncbi:hypothetical protein BVX94_03470 [bacterium B17]|nr:hypothetical protein BVX94_03470 [bacterium B17]